MDFSFKKKPFYLALLLSIVLLTFLVVNKLKIDESPQSFKRRHFQSAEIKGRYLLKKTLPRKGKPIFTQGLTFLNNSTLIESGGIYGQSSINYIEYPSLRQIKTKGLHGRYFAEGLDFHYDERENLEIYQLTYREREILVYDKNFIQIRSIALPQEIAEGWGIAKFKNQRNETKFLVSDGTESIFVVNPKDFAVERVITPFSHHSIPLFSGNLYNELEVYDNRIILSNVWTLDLILAIDIQTGRILKVYDMSELKNYVINNNLYPYVDVANDIDYCLNGIAYNKHTNSFLLTGKRWSYMFEVEFLGL